MGRGRGWGRFLPCSPLTIICHHQGRARAQELCESRGGRPGLPSLINNTSTLRGDGTGAGGGGGGRFFPFIPLIIMRRYQGRFGEGEGWGGGGLIKFMPCTPLIIMCRYHGRSEREVELTHAFYACNNYRPNYFAVTGNL